MKTTPKLLTAGAIVTLILIGGTASAAVPVPCTEAAGYPTMPPSATPLLQPVMMPTGFNDYCVMFGGKWTNGVCTGMGSPAKPGASVIDTVWNFITHKRR